MLKNSFSKIGKRIFKKALISKSVQSLSSYTSQANKVTKLNDFFQALTYLS
eukprot:c41015_g1_i1 orf=106-258(+)